MMQADDTPGSENTPLFDGRRVRNYLAFIRGALRRHRWLVAIIVVVIVATTIAVVSSLPKTYHVEAKVLAHGNAALTVRGDAPGGEAPTRTAAETILRRDALIALIQQHDLIRQYQEHRAPAERARDAIVHLISQPETADDRMDAMVERLEKHLSVWTNESGSTVTIAVDWPDPHMAVRIIDSAQQNYLESRYAQEVTALSESMGILQSHEEGSRAEVDDAVAALQKVRADKDARLHPAEGAVTSQHPRTVSSPLPSPPPPAQRLAPLDPAQVQLKASIDAKQRAVADLEDFRSRRLTDLQGRLAEQQTIYTENHPAVVDLKQAIAAVSGESPQVKSLRSEIAVLKAEYEHRTAAETPPDAAHMVAAPTRTARPLETTTRELPSELLRLDPELREERDPNILHARGELRDAMDKYATLRTHIQTTEIDLETAKAAFKYRYSVITPAHVPKKPVKPNTLLISLASVLASLVVAGFLAVVADLRGGRLVERWQLERLLDRPIVADIELPQLPGPDTE